MKIYLRNLLNPRFLIISIFLLMSVGAYLPATAADPVVAEIGSEKITLSQFKAELNKLPPNLKQMTADKKIRKEFLEQFTTSRLLFQEGVNQGLTKDPAIKSQIDDATRKIVLTTLLQREIESRIKKPTQDEVNQYYLTHAEEFRQEKQVRARHILLKDKDEADKVAAELKKGADFAALAKEKSTCPSAAKGGDLGFFTRNRMVKEFADTAFALKQGEISAPVKTKFGYHIIQVEDIKEASTRPLNEVRTTIENKLSQEKKNQIFKIYRK